MHIAIAFDENYLTPFYVLLTSIFYHNHKEEITFHCIISGINDLEKKEIVEYITRNKCEIFFYNIDIKMLQAFSSTLNNKWTLAAYYKIFFPKIIPFEIDRLLYIDTDTVVINPLKELYYENIDDVPLGAVPDCYVKSRPELGILGENNYFNSGVLLFNLRLWRNQKISEQTIDFLNSHTEKIEYVDQDALNAILVNNWKSLDYRYNVIYSYLPQDVPWSTLKKNLQDKVIIHFTLHRPWNLLCRNRYRILYKKYMKLSPLKNKRMIIDFSYKKIPAYLKLRLIEFYLDNNFLHKIWRFLKLK